MNPNQTINSTNRDELCSVEFFQVTSSNSCRCYVQILGERGGRFRIDAAWKPCFEGGVGGGLLTCFWSGLRLHVRQKGVEAAWRGL